MAHPIDQLPHVHRVTGLQHAQPTDGCGPAFPSRHLQVAGKERIDDQWKQADAGQGDQTPRHHPRTAVMRIDPSR